MSQTLNLKIDRDTCFSDAKGNHKPRQEKKSLKALTRLSPLLERVLEPGEEVRFITQGSSPYSTFELLTTGKFIRVVKFSILVVTDRRLLHLPAKSLYKDKGAVSEVRFADLAAARRGGILGVLEVEYLDGKKEKFKTVPLGAIAKLVAVVEEGVGQGTPSAEARRHALCPRCAKRQTPGVFTCPSCQLEFKSKGMATAMSILVPGGGYFYVGQKLLGVMDAIVETALLAVVAFGAGSAMNGNPEAWSTTIVFGAVLAFEKAITVYHAHHAVKDFLPRRRKELTEPTAAVPQAEAVSAPAVQATAFSAAPLEP